ncbi:hypothetical protein XELAEV_18037506mg [Xenopus laevis]|uniref:Dishevelled segment polarity protein 1 n=1 Tax=Xenopus laevis TaxID=8355 RepID=A0A974CCG1_XENLA|nr:hypothetical protein XELAEV_18037506mg [Xenopus laevis]
MAETKIIYHIDEEETPYLVKLPVPPEKVTLADFKNVLSNRPVHHYKFFFKSMDQDFGVVKEEISDDNAKLPCFNGRVVSWLVLAESSHSDGGSQSNESRTDLPLPIERTGGIGDSRPPSFHPNASCSRDGLDNETGRDSVVSHRRDRHRRKNRETHDDVPRINGHPKLDRIRDPGGYDSASTVMSSELESSSFVDSDEDENTSRVVRKTTLFTLVYLLLYSALKVPGAAFLLPLVPSGALPPEASTRLIGEAPLPVQWLSSSTEQSTSSRLIRKHKRRRRKQKMRQVDRSSSFSSITDSTMSLNIITVILNMGKCMCCTTELSPKNPYRRNAPTAHAPKCSSKQEEDRVEEDGACELRGLDLRRRCFKTNNQITYKTKGGFFMNGTFSDWHTFRVRAHLEIRGDLVARRLFASSLGQLISPNCFPVASVFFNEKHGEAVREKYNFLGISIVGQSNDRGDGGIYIGSIMKGGAVAADGRIEPGDMLLQVNDVNFENMSNDDAVRVLREIVSKPGPISLTVAKCWDPTPRSYFTIPRAEPVRPIDPAAWITHTSALTGTYPRYGMSPSMSIITCTSSSLTSSKSESEKQEDSPLSVKSDMATIVKVMQLPDSGLEIRDRMWLKITISNAVIGADIVDWLYTHVEGFKERREARKYASSMLKHGYLRHTVNKITFSEQCYYIFGDLCSNVAALNLNDGSSGTFDQDTLAPLPNSAAPWPLGQGYSYQYPLAPPCFPPTYQEPGFSYGSGSAGSQHSEGSKSSGSSRSNREGKRSSGREKERRSTGSGSGSDHAPRSGGSKNERPLSQHSHHSHSSVSWSQRSHRSSHHSHGPPGLPPLFTLPKIGNKVYGTSGPPGGPPVRELGNVPPELTGSRQSFQKAMGNPCEFFVDIM